MAIVWNREDDFDSTPTYGDRVLGYYCFVPNSFHTYGPLCDFDQDGSPSPHGRDGTNPTGPVCYAWRGEELTEPSVTLTTSIRTSIGLDSATQMREAAVLAKVQGSTLVGGGTVDQYVSPADCYAFGIRGTASLAGGTITFFLERWKGGVVSSLGVLGPLPLGDATFDGSKPFSLRMDVQEFAGVAVGIYCYIANFQTSTGATTTNPIPIFGNLATTGPVIDLWADAIQGTGRCGFALGQDQTLTISPLTADITQKVHQFRIRENTGGTLGEILHWDDFTRQSAGTEGIPFTDDFGTVGRCFQGVFRYDFCTGVVNYTDAYLEAASTLADTAEYNPTSASSRRRLCLSQRPPDDPVNQHPRATIRWTGSGSGVVRAGVAARASGINLTSIWNTTRGYCAMANRTTNQIVVSRLPGQVNGNLITDLATYSTTLNVATDYDIGLRVVPATQVEDGPQLLELYVGGSVVTLNAIADVPGLASDSGGGVIDSSSERILSGGEGLIFWSEGTERVIIRDWGQGVLVVNKDEPSVVLSDEGASAATLAFEDALISQPIQSDEGWFVDRTQFESGHTLARTRFQDQRQRWPDLRTVPLTRAQRDTFLAFWRARTGAVEPFTWNNPQDSTDYVVRFLPGDLEQTELFRDVWVIRFGFEEVL